MGIHCHKLTKLLVKLPFENKNEGQCASPTLHLNKQVLAKLSETLESIERLRSAYPPRPNVAHVRQSGPDAGLDGTPPLARGQAVIGDEHASQV